MRDSYLSCPRDGKRLAIDQADEDGRRAVLHRCLHCTFTTSAPSQPPQSTGSPLMTKLRDMVRDG